VTPKTCAAAYALPCLALSSLLAACGSERMSLGANETENAAAVSPCGDGIVNGDIQIARQRDLDALLGCEVIDGDVRILQPPASGEQLNLAPLASLRQVTGTLKLEQLHSLAGLDALAQVGNLELLRLGTEDLTGLSRLERVQWDPPILGYAGFITITDCENLPSLAGLERLTAWNGLNFRNAPALETLSGLAGPERSRASTGCAI